MNNIFKRGVSGTIYVLIMFWCTIYSEITFRLLFGIIGIISIREMLKILRNQRNKLLPMIYVIIPMIIIQYLPQQNPSKEFDQSIILFILILIWTFDTFAYLVGSMLGKNKIAPSISPKKSWEGLLGGFVLTIIMSYFLRLENFIVDRDVYVDPVIFSVAPFLIPITATLGDLSISYHKRKAEVKDSGNLIPGHGGILDRMDALLITIPTIFIIQECIYSFCIVIN